MPIVKAKNDFFQINSVGLFNKSTLKLTLKPEETKMFNFLRNREQKSAIKVKKGDTTIVIDTHKVKTNYKLLTPKDRTPYVKINVSMEGNLEEASNRVPIGNLSDFEKAAQKFINKRIENLLV